MIRLLVASPLLIASDVARTTSDTLFNLGAIVAGSTIRRQP